MDLPATIIRPLQDIDIEACIRLSIDAGWNQTEYDWRFIITNPRNICLAAECEKKIIATTTAINYADQVSWIGMVLVDKAYRGHGLSKLLLTTIFEKLNGFSSIKLDATPEGQPVYKKLDFKDEYQIARMVNFAMKHVTPEEDARVPEAVRPQHLEEVVSLDQESFGVSRSSLVKFLVNEHPDSSWFLNEHDRITGFVSGRNGRKYYQVGPVVASNTIDAKTLITKALNQLTNKAVVVDVPYDKVELIKWLNAMGFTRQRSFTRMYRKENPFTGIPGKQHLICGPEFG